VIHGVELCPRQRHVPSHAIPSLQPRCHDLWRQDVLPRHRRSWRREKGLKLSLLRPEV
jgi:hypothetical protein